VEIASTIENAESIPRVNNVMKRSKFQKFDNGISAAAVGKATYARPKVATCLETGFPLFLRYPMIENTVNPEIKLIIEFEIAIMKLS